MGRSKKRSPRVVTQLKKIIMDTKAKQSIYHAYDESIGLHDDIKTQIRLCPGLLEQIWKNENLIYETMERRLFERDMLIRVANDARQAFRSREVEQIAEVLDVDVRTRPVKHIILSFLGGEPSYNFSFV